jgi:hypothetical protein
VIVPKFCGFQRRKFNCVFEVQLRARRPANVILSAGPEIT